MVTHAEDGSRLVLADDEGAEYWVPVTDDLRLALRRAKVAAASVAPPEPETDEPSLSPREIQRRIRSGLTAAELAELTGVPVESVEPFEGPVLAEREYVASVARTTRIGRDSTSPSLGDLVADRLASRGVDAEDIHWDAYRDEGAPWTVVVDFTTGGRNVRAAWHYDHVGRTVTALDDEATWLSETELLDVPIPRRHLTAVDTQTAAPRPADTDVAQETAPSSPAEDLLDELNAQRGQRQDLSLDEEDQGDFEDFGPTATPREGTVSFAPQPAASTPHPSRTGLGKDGGSESDVPAAGAGNPAVPETASLKRPKRGRASVPSWDEIVFGAKNSQD